MSKGGERSARRALVMAFDDPYAVAGETCLYSVLRHNPWFDARVVVISDGIGARSAAALERLYEVEFVVVDPALKAAAQRLVRSGLLSPAVAKRLTSLQLFSLSGLERAVFLDADTVCLGDLRALFECPADFAAAPDLVQLEREFSPRDQGEPQPYGRSLAYSFNSGVMSVSARWLNESTYRELLELSDLGEGQGAPELADQYVLNHYFDGRVDPLDPRYNFLVSAQALLRRRYALALSDARILHFAGYSKPWQLRDPLRSLD